MVAETAASDEEIRLPEFLTGICTQDKYWRWLDRRAKEHARRDRRRGNPMARAAEYRVAIHEAVLRGGGRDAYTGQALRWDLIGRYDNAASRRGGRAYKKERADLPTVDHVGDGLGRPDFAICSWRVNDAKSDLTLGEFLELCREVLDFSGRKGTGL